MTMQLVQNHDLKVAAGLGAWLSDLHEGLGVPGPYGANPSSMVPAGTYEISGTQVNFRSGPSKSAGSIGMFNPDASAGDKVVGVPDQVTFNGQTATGDGLTWAQVTAKGQSGYVAMQYMAPVGWTASHGGTAPGGGGGGGGGGGSNVSTTTTTTTMTDYAPWLLGGAAVLGLAIVGWAVLAPKKGGGGARRMGRRRRISRRRRR